MVTNHTAVICVVYKLSMHHTRARAAFFVQVERSRLPAIRAPVPCAVQQHKGIIAVSYEARAMGVQKGMRPGDVSMRTCVCVCVYSAIACPRRRRATVSAASQQHRIQHVVPPLWRQICRVARGGAMGVSPPNDDQTAAAGCMTCSCACCEHACNIRLTRYGASACRGMRASSSQLHSLHPHPCRRSAAFANGRARSAGAGLVPRRLTQIRYTKPLLKSVTRNVQVRARFPGVRLVHVATLGGTGKVTYRAYRQASNSIFTLLGSRCSVMERTRCARGHSVQCVPLCTCVYVCPVYVSVHCVLNLCVRVHVCVHLEWGGAR
jgi:impB/mucB/samB family